MSLRDNNSMRGLGASRLSEGGYTLTEMIVVAGIIVFVAGISVPLMAPFFRGGAVREASDVFKMACVSARSRAVQENEDQHVFVVAGKDEQSVQVLSGPRLVAAVAATVSTNNTISGASLGTPDQWKGYFAVVLSGSSRGQTRAIDSNTATQLTLKADWTANPPVGSLFQIYKKVDRKVNLPRNALFDFTGVRIYTFTPTGTIKVPSSSHLNFSIEDVKKETGRDFQLYTSTGMVYTEEKEY